MLEQSLDYLLADKQGADLSDTLIAEACQTLHTNREGISCRSATRRSSLSWSRPHRSGSRPITSCANWRWRLPRRQPGFPAKFSPLGWMPVFPNGRRRIFSGLLGQVERNPAAVIRQFIESLTGDGARAAAHRTRCLRAISQCRFSIDRVWPAASLGTVWQVRLR